MMPVSGMPRFQPNYYVACRLQDRILNTIGVDPQTKKRVDLSLKTKLKPVELASLVKSWDLLEDRKRVLRGKGLPKPLEAPQKPKATKQAVFSE